jgi:hypothetical protein
MSKDEEVKRCPKDARVKTKEEKKRKTGTA